MRWALLVVLAAATVGVAFGQQGQAGPPKDKVEAAVKRGVGWLIGKQNADGSWTVGGGQAAAAGGIGKPLEELYPEGTTALVLFALLKGGVKPGDDCIKKGFAYLRGKPFKATYSVSCLILALSALYEPRVDSGKGDRSGKPGSGGKMRTEVYKEPHDVRVRKAWQRKASPAVKKWMEDAVRWLLAQQEKNIWRYPGPMPGAQNPDTDAEDFSNTQYAMLALAAARRLGIAVPNNAFERVAEWSISNQEQKGPEVDWFPVPAADFDMSKLKKMERTVRKQLQKMAREERRMGLKPDKSADVDKSRTTVVLKPYDDKRYRAEKKKMYARGWRYTAQGGEPYCGSMTTSGVAALVICKAALEGTPYYQRNKKKINQGIRDGAAWLAHNFTVSTNPGRPGMWHYYYLYGLERAGVLALCNRFGKHDWYAEGSAFLLGSQRPDGSWSQDGMISALSNTCFAILFLKKATTPMVKLGDKDTVFSGKGIVVGGGK